MVLKLEGPLNRRSPDAHHFNKTNESVSNILHNTHLPAPAFPSKKPSFSFEFSRRLFLLRRRTQHRSDLFVLVSVIAKCWNLFLFLKRKQFRLSNARTTSLNFPNLFSVLLSNRTRADRPKTGVLNKSSVCRWVFCSLSCGVRLFWLSFNRAWIFVVWRSRDRLFTLSLALHTRCSICIPPERRGSVLLQTPAIYESHRGNWIADEVNIRW